MRTDGQKYMTKLTVPFFFKHFWKRLNWLCAQKTPNSKRLWPPTRLHGIMQTLRQWLTIIFFNERHLRLSERCCWWLKAGGKIVRLAGLKGARRFAGPRFIHPEGQTVQVERISTAWFCGLRRYDPPKRWKTTQRQNADTPETPELPPPIFSDKYA